MKKPRRRRERLMDATEKLAPEVGTAAACRAMGVSRATVYRRRSRQSIGDRSRLLQADQRRELSKDDANW